MKLTDGDRIFKDALLRGTGRCFAMLATESARRKYRPLVMWACGRNLGYDTQIEGTRVLFLYDLIGQYPSPEPFLDIVEKSFFASFNKGNWLFEQECELLALFAKTGNERAHRILEQGYLRFSQYLKRLNLERISKPYIPAPDNYDSLCEQLVYCAKPAEAPSMVERIVRDVGGLCMRDSFWILDLFRAPKFKGYLPLDSVLRDASSDDDELRDSALRALDGIKDQRVRDFAFDVLKKRGMSYEIASLIASNYRESDDNLLIAAMKKLGEMRRHHLGIGMLNNAGGKGGRLSKRILIYLFDTTRCSFCRERVVRELGRRGFLTREMAEECLHDANNDIRDYAKRFLSRRRAKVTSNPVQKQKVRTMKPKPTV